MIGVSCFVMLIHSIGGSLVGRVFQLDWRGELELVECFLDISWHGDFQYSGLVVPVQCNTTVNTPCPIFCYLIFSLGAFIRCWLSSLIWYLMPKLLTTRVYVILFLLGPLTTV